MAKIPDGNYRLIFCFGGKEITKVDKFVSATGSSEFEDRLNYEIRKVRSIDRITTYTNAYTVTLHQVLQGKAETDKISVSEFDKY
jgi:hypothetical protein